MKLFDVSILSIKASDANTKTLAQAEFPVHALSEHHMKVKRVKQLLVSKCCHFVKEYFLAIEYLDAYVQCLYNVYAKHQMSTEKAPVQVEFPVYALSEFLYKILMKKKSEKNAKFKML